MAKKSFTAGGTKTGILNSDGGEKLKEIQAKTQYNFKYIPKDKIVSNPKNEMYTQDGINALKESILVNGLRHNLSVLYDSDKDIYRLISGERRYHAISEMDEKDYQTLFPAGIPCKVEKSDITEIDEEIMLISANHDVRESSMEVKRWEVSRLKELYEAKKLNGEIKNINAEIAKQLNISERQARKYTTAEKLIPELSELLNNNGIDLNQADKFGKLDEDAQKSILNILQKNGNIENAEFQSIKKISEERAKEAAKYKQELEEVTRELNKKNETLEILENKINEISTNTDKSNSKIDIEEELRYMTEAKNKAEKEKARLESNMEKMKQQQREKEQRKTTISDNELKRIKRVANRADIEVYNINKIKAQKSFEICKEIIAETSLDMHLINCEYTLDASKVIFMYTSDERVDFRDLLKKLASVFKCRIELRQVGPRDKAKIVGGIGNCGLPLCCNSFLGEFDGVSINMAKNQLLAINIDKISGVCGRLLCCLKYEDEAYKEVKKKFPKIGSFIRYDDKQCKVVGLNVISDLVKNLFVLDCCFLQYLNFLLFWLLLDYYLV